MTGETVLAVGVLAGREHQPTALIAHEGLQAADGVGAQTVGPDIAQHHHVPAGEQPRIFGKPFRFGRQHLHSLRRERIRQMARPVGAALHVEHLHPVVHRHILDQQVVAGQLVAFGADARRDPVRPGLRKLQLEREAVLARGERYVA